MALWFITRGISCLVLPCALSSCFFSPFRIVITSLGEEEAGHFACVDLLLFFFSSSSSSSSWCHGLVAASYCGTLWTFLLTFLSRMAWWTSVGKELISGLSAVLL